MKPAVLVGLAVGDALGMPFERRGDAVHKDLPTWNGHFRPGTYHKLPAGHWTDDTEMALALASSILDGHCYDPHAAARWYLSWAEGTPHGMGGSTRKAMAKLAAGVPPHASGTTFEDPDTVGNGTAFFEAVLATNLDRGIIYSDPIAISRDARQLGLSIGVVQDIGAYAQLGARYDRYDADRDAMDREGLDLVGTHKILSTLAVMAAARWPASNDARITVEYDHERNPFGRGDDGAPITRSADRITLRAQVGF